MTAPTAPNAVPTYVDGALLPKAVRASDARVAFHYGLPVGPPAINRLSNNVASGIYFEAIQLIGKDVDRDPTTGKLRVISVKLRSEFAIGDHTVTHTQETVFSRVNDDKWGLRHNYNPRTNVRTHMHPASAFAQVIGYVEEFGNRPPAYVHVSRQTKGDVVAQFALADSPFFMPINDTDLKFVKAGNEARIKGLSRHVAVLWADAAWQLDDPASQFNTSLERHTTADASPAVEGDSTTMGKLFKFVSTASISGTSFAKPYRMAKLAAEDHKAVNFTIQGV